MIGRTYTRTCIGRQPVNLRGISNMRKECNKPQIWATRKLDFKSWASAHTCRCDVLVQASRSKFTLHKTMQSVFWWLEKQLCCEIEPL